MKHSSSHVFVPVTSMSTPVSRNETHIGEGRLKPPNGHDPCGSSSKPREPGVFAGEMDPGDVNEEEENEEHSSERL